MSQAANTFWDERLERISGVVRGSAVEKKRVRVRRLIDGIILTVLLAAAGTCVSVYSRAGFELNAALTKHRKTSDRVQDLKNRVENLERDVKQLRTDSRVIELLARQKFGFVRSGDIVIKLATDVDEGVKSQDGLQVARAASGSGASGTSASGKLDAPTGGRIY